MADYTNNLNLKKQALNEFVEIEGFNNNFDTIDKAFEDMDARLAGGTAAALAITISTVKAYRPGMRITVIASNNCTSSTITLRVNNLAALPVYKPNTQTAPKITAGKPYSFIVSQDLSCFFLNASGASGVTALAGDVLSPKVIVNDDGDEIIGTIPSKGTSANWPASDVYGYSGGVLLKPQSGNYTPSGVSSNPGTIAGWVQATDPDFVASNLRKGINAFGLVGDMDPGTPINFPLSIQDAQPTAVGVGHVWIKSSTLAPLITSLKILEAVNAGETDGSLMFVVGSMTYNYFEFRNAEKKLTSGGNTINALAFKNNGVNYDQANYWFATYILGSSYFILNKPMVYSKVGGTLDIETAYLWNGTSWVMISQKGSYLAYRNSTGNAIIYNQNSLTSYALNSTQTSQIPGSDQFKFSTNGIYLFTGDKVFKRIGDVFTLYYTLATILAFGSYTFNKAYASMSDDGSTLGISYFYHINSGWHWHGVAIYKNNGSGFTLVHQYSTQGSQQVLLSNSIIAVNHDGSLVVHIDPTQGDATYSQPRIFGYFRNTDGTYSGTGAIMTEASSTMMTGLGWWTPYFNSDGSRFYLHVYYNSGTWQSRAFVWSVNYISKTITNAIAYQGINGNFNTRCKVYGNLLFRRTDGAPYLTAYNMVLNVYYTVTSNYYGGSGYFSSMAFNAAGTVAYLYYTNGVVYVCSCVINHGAQTVSFTLQYTLGGLTADGHELSVCP